MRLVRTLKLALPLALVASQPAVAAPSDLPSLATVENSHAQFRYLAGNGYAVSVSGSGRRVRLTVERDLATALYITRGRVSRGKIRARFGHLGLVSMRFKPTDRISSSEPPEGCKGNAALQQRGVFVGTIRFRGEEGYVTVDSHRVRGYLSNRPHWRCARGSLDRAGTGRERRGTGMASLTASIPDEQVVFRASGLSDKEGEIFPFAFVVLTKEQLASVRIIRYLLDFPDGDEAFTLGDDGRSATLRPSKPFHGEATYDGALPGPERWSGTLAVDLLGATVALTGPRFRVRFNVSSRNDADAAVAPRFNHLVAP